MEVLSIILGIAFAGAVGYLIGRNYSSGAQEKTRLEQEVNEKQAELEAFRNKVTSHFEKTADLFNQVSDSYQSLYDHIATSSNQLCATPSFQALPKKDATETSQLLSGKAAEKADKNVFDANKLYNAYDYKTQLEPENTGEPILSEEDAKVVDIESAKADKVEPALDYAIKEKGVINHNSLDTDSVKSS